jgi:hypothetical protein
MPLVRLPCRAQWLFAAPVKSSGQWCERGFIFIESNLPIAFEIQADFDAAGMKTLALIEFPVRLEVVPLKTHACAAHAAMQMPPTIANRAPHRSFCERRRDLAVGRLDGFSKLLWKRRHGRQCAISFASGNRLVIRTAKNSWRNAPLENSNTPTARFCHKGYSACA